MHPSDARVVDIPSLTKTEAVDQEKAEMQAIFQGEDLSGLDIDNRRQRKVSVQNIDEWLTNLRFVPEDDGDDDNPLDDRGGFRKGYRMRLRSDVLEEEKLDTIAEKTTITSCSRPRGNTDRLRGEYTLALTVSGHGSGERLVHRFRNDTLRDKDRLWVFVCQDTQMYAGECMCGAKVFTRKNSIILVRGERSLSPPREYPKGLVRTRSTERPLLPLSELQPPLDSPDRLGGLARADRHSYLLGQRDPSLQSEGESLFLWAFVEGALLALEWREDPELSDNLDLTEIHWVGPEGGVFQGVKARLDSLTRQEGVHPASRFVQRLLEGGPSPPSPESPGPSPPEGLTVKQICEEAHLDMEALSPPRRKPSLSQGGRLRSRFVDFDYEEDTGDPPAPKPHSREPSPPKGSDEASYSM